MDKINFSDWLDLREAKDACYHKVKSRYKVWPSAYACVPVQTSKALTKEGWKYYKELSVGEEILTYSLKNDCLEFQPIKNLYRYENADTYVVRNGDTGWKFECTPNHKWVVKHPKVKDGSSIKKFTDMVNDMRLATTEELLSNGGSNRKLVISSKYYDGNPVEMQKIYKHQTNKTKSCKGLRLIDERKADVWCPETENGTWVMMQETDGQTIITITGNSGALVRCRKVGADNWGNKSEQQELDENIFKLEKERGLRGWFDRNKGKGWIDCKASKKGNLVPCGREKAGKGAKRSYPACRPTLSACNKSKHKKKTSKAISWKTKSESRLDELNWKSLLAGGALLTGAGNAGAADPIHNFSGEKLVQIGQSEKNLETDERFIKSWTMIKETITNKIKKNPNIRFLHIEVISEHHQGKKTAVVSLFAQIQAEDEQLAKQILIREVTRSAAEVGLQGEAIRGLKQIFVNSNMSNESMGSIFNLKLIITPQTAFWSA